MKTHFRPRKNTSRQWVHHPSYATYIYIYINHHEKENEKFIIIIIISTFFFLLVVLESSCDPGFPTVHEPAWSKHDNNNNNFFFFLSSWACKVSIPVRSFKWAKERNRKNTLIELIKKVHLKKKKTTLKIYSFFHRICDLITLSTKGLKMIAKEMIMHGIKIWPSFVGLRFLEFFYTNSNKKVSFFPENTMPFLSRSLTLNSYCFPFS